MSFLLSPPTQVLLKLVQRIALLRSSSSSSNNNPNANGDPPSKKSKKSSTSSSKKKKSKNQKKPSKSDIGSSGSSVAVTAAAASAEEDKSVTQCPEGRLPASPRGVVEVLDKTAAAAPVHGQQSPLSVRKLLPRVEASVPNNSGNYHAQIAPLFVDSDGSGSSASQNSYDRTTIGPVEPRPAPDSNAIECTSFSELILDRPQQPHSSLSTRSSTSSFASGGSDCNLEFCELEQSCDEILLLEQQIFECCDGDDDDGSDVVSLIRPSEEQETINPRLNMGANVSRHHEKGLTGRRAQSTGKSFIYSVFQSGINELNV